MTNYPPPLDKFLARGEPPARDEWPNYLHGGIGPEYVPDLIRMATDPELNEAPGGSPQVWAPLYAWRALGQLRAASAVEPLLQFLDRAARDDDDNALEELPEVFGLIGEPALPALTAFLSDPSHELYARWAVIQALGEISENHPAARPACVDLLTQQLRRAAEESPEFNAAVISELLDLKATEAAPAIEQAFATGKVEESICGDWKYAQYELGLRSEPPRTVYDHLDRLGTPGGTHTPRARAKQRAKARRKDARKARKRNRKRK